MPRPIRQREQGRRDMRADQLSTCQRPKHQQPQTHSAAVTRPRERTSAAAAVIGRGTRARMISPTALSALASPRNAVTAATMSRALDQRLRRSVFVTFELRSRQAAGAGASLNSNRRSPARPMGGGAPRSRAAAPTPPAPPPGVPTPCATRLPSPYRYRHRGGGRSLPAGRHARAASGGPPPRAPQAQIRSPTGTGHHMQRVKSAARISRRLVRLRANPSATARCPASNDA